MIVRPAADGLHLITQPDHAALSARIMENWVTLAERPRRESILLAIAEHDNGWKEPDDLPMVDPQTGRVADFITVPVAVRQGVWPRAIARLAHTSWAAALVAQHAVYVYNRYRGDAAWTTFFTDLECLRDDFVNAAGLTMNDLLRDYVFVRLGDLISLTFCTAWTDPEDHGGFVVVRRDTRVTVIPDPFGGREIPIEVRARQLPDRRFESDTDLREALQSAPETLLRGIVVGH